MIQPRSRSYGLLTLAAALLLPLGLAPAAAAGERTPLSVKLETKGFEQIARRKGVTVYKHRYDSNIRLGADATIDAPVKDVLRAVLDYRGQVGKIARLSESRVLQRGKGWLKVYQRLNLPVISDRDFNLKVRWGQTGDTTWVDYRAVERGGAPPRGGVVRVSHHEGSWQLQPIKGGLATRVRFQVSIDMSGWLPKWLARSGSGKEVPEVFVALRGMIMRPDYRSARCNSTKC